MHPTTAVADRPAVTVPAAAHGGGTAHMVRIEAFTPTSGQHAVSLVGLPDDSVATTRDRLYAAIVNSGLSWPNQAVVLRVFPEPLTAADSGLDTAFAVALLAATGQVPTHAVTALVCVGELGLDGALRPVRAVAERAAAIAAAGFPTAVVADADLRTAAPNLGEAARSADTLRQLAAMLSGQAAWRRPAAWPATPGPGGADLAYLPATHPGRRALEVAAAGGHHLALIGPTGSGTVMLATRLPGLLPDLDEVADEVAPAYRKVGLLGPHAAAPLRPSWQAPHHTASLPALTGNTVRPGAAALAHGGVLFLDQAAELPDPTIRALATVLDHGQIRVSATVRYPARFQLVLASPDCPNPTWHPAGDCDCPPARRQAYLRRLTPLLRRTELRVTLPPPPAAGADTTAGETTATVAARVAAARGEAADRWTRYGFATNHDAATGAMRDLADRWATQLTDLRARPNAATLTFDSAVQVLAVAWTLADLAGRAEPDDGDIAEAIGLHDPQLLAGQVES